MTNRVYGTVLSGEGKWRQLQLAISVASVPDGVNIYHSLFIIDGINDPVISNTEAPEVFFTDDLPALPRTRVLHQSLDFQENAIYKGYVKGLQFFPGRAGEYDFIFIHEASPFCAAVHGHHPWILVVHFPCT